MIKLPDDIAPKHWSGGLIILIVLIIVFLIISLTNCTTIHPYYTTPILDRIPSEKPPEPPPAPHDYLSDYILLMLITQNMQHRGTSFLSPLSSWDMERMFLLHSLIMNEILVARMFMLGL